ncbi:MAG: hypothetical protein H0U73_02735 [Tatlockia sp.]|nr:hypothetical protein [Tatlockia sp.]
MDFLRQAMFIKFVGTH